MESEKQRLYSVLTRTDVRDKMMKEIVQISEVFSLSQSDATVALIRLGWDSLRASDLLGDNKDKFLSGLGLVQVSDSNRTDGDGDTLVSTLFCSHKFCSDCWRDYLEEKKDMISCFNQDCVASVGPDTIEKLAGPVKEMYERYVLGSFMESNEIKLCPASGCDYAIERHEDVSEDDGDESVMVCLCGHTFCWVCKLESHRPVTCNNASLWLNELLGEAKTLGRFAKNSKPCPRCQSHVRKHSSGDLRIVTCVCSYAFCWRCLTSEEDHRGVYHCSEVNVPPPQDEATLLRHLTLWEVSQEAMEVSKRDLAVIELKSIPVLTERTSLGEEDMRALREASMLIVQCRLVLKWSSVFGYFISDYHSARKQYLDHLVTQATANLVKHKGVVDEVMKGAISGGGITSFRHKLETSTTATGNYFHNFVKTVEDGLWEVKDGFYENVPTDYWFCDRCTFQNDAFEQKCRICVFPFEGPSLVGLAINNNNSTAVANQQELPNVSSNPFASPPLLTFGTAINPFSGEGGSNTVAFGDNNTASAHQQGVPNMSTNPFAREGRTNLFESATVVAFGNNNSGHQQGVPNMSNNPFAPPGGSSIIGASDMSNNPFASFVGFGNNNNGTAASGHQQQAPNMMVNNPFGRQGGANASESGPYVGLGYKNNSGSGHQQQASNINNPIVFVKEEPNLGNSIESE